MVALLLSLYRVFGKREIKEEKERVFARMRLRARGRYNATLSG